MTNKNTEIARLQAEVQAFQAYTAKMGAQPAQAQPEAQQDYFRSTQELITVMSDPRYKSDPAFREEVQAHMAGSDANGIELVRTQRS